MNKKRRKVDTHSTKTTFFLAWKNIIASKKTLAIITLVLSLSFLSITFFAAIIDGLGYAFEQKSINTITGHITIEPKNDEAYISNPDEILRKIRKVDGVKASSRIEKGVSVSDGETVVSAQTLFINPTYEKEVSIFLDSIVSGEPLTKDVSNEVVIGSDLVRSYAAKDDNKKRLDVRVGDIITLQFNNGVSKKYKIRGIYKTNSAFSDGYILINDKEYKNIYGVSANTMASSIIVKLPRRGLENEYIDKFRELGVNEEINSWTTKISKIKQFTSSLEITNKITGLIGLITTFATIYIIIFINVMTKRKQIGILKAIGIKKGIILGSYVIQSLVYAILGVLTGIAIIKLLMVYFSSNPLKMPIGDVYPLVQTSKLMMASASIILASLAAGYFPAKKATEDNILDAIFGG
jgi:putative ABC transport system permease protein